LDTPLQTSPSTLNAKDTNVHHSRLCAVLIDCRTSDVDEAARFWAEALGRPVDLRHPGSRDNYRMLETPPDEPIVQIQRVQHESRVHIDIETDDIAAEVARLEKHRRQGRPPSGTLGGDAGADWTILVRGPRSTSRLPQEREPMGLKTGTLNRRTARSEYLPHED
jgi:hypothetical protein